MCSRFEMKAPAGDLARRFGLGGPPPVPNKGEIRPTDQALVIAARNGGPNSGPWGRLLSWGLSAEWSPKPLINARAETIGEKKTFQPLLESRCLVPATAYFEWRKSGDAKLKNRIAPADGGVLAFAGLSDGERFTVITCPPASGIAHIHDRMPAILARAAEERWIDPGLSFTEVRGLLVPFETEPLEAEEETPALTPEKDLFG